VSLLVRARTNIGQVRFVYSKSKLYKEIQFFGGVQNGSPTCKTDVLLPIVYTLYIQISLGLLGQTLKLQPILGKKTMFYYNNIISAP